MGDSSYTVKGTITGKRTVVYPCPVCGESLTNPMSKAGESDHCPACGKMHMVPGRATLEAEQREREVLAAAAQREQAEAIDAQDRAQAEFQERMRKVEADERRRSRWESGGDLVVQGWVGWGIGILLLGIALFMEVSTDGSVVNIGLLNTRECIVVLAAAMLVVGAVFTIGGQICKALGKFLRQVAEPERK